MDWADTEQRIDRWPPPAISDPIGPVIRHGRTRVWDLTGLTPAFRLAPHDHGRGVGAPADRVAERDARSVDLA